MFLLTHYSPLPFERILLERPDHRVKIGMQINHTKTKIRLDNELTFSYTHIFINITNCLYIELNKGNFILFLKFII